jgi:hypothetical protein
MMISAATAIRLAALAKAAAELPERWGVPCTFEVATGAAWRPARGSESGDGDGEILCGIIGVWVTVHGVEVVICEEIDE